MDLNILYDMDAKGRQALDMVKRLRVWRKKNRLTRRQAAAVMEARGVPVDVMVIYHWEKEHKTPNRMSVAMVSKFLEEFPVITEAPAFGKKTRLSAQDLAEIRRLRKEDQTLKAIGERFGVDESYVSRIVRGERLSKVPGVKHLSSSD